MEHIMMRLQPALGVCLGFQGIKLSTSHKTSIKELNLDSNT